MIKGTLFTFHKNKKKIMEPGQCLGNYFANKSFNIPGHRRVKTASTLIKLSLLKTLNTAIYSSKKEICNCLAHWDWPNKKIKYFAQLRHSEEDTDLVQTYKIYLQCFTFLHHPCESIILVFAWMKIRAGKLLD